MATTGNKIALITGGNKGIGFEVARQLGQAGCTVILGCRDKARGDQAASELAAQHIDVRSVAIDLLDHATFAAAADTLLADFGRLDILVNNAGVYLPGDGAASQADFAAVGQTFRTNFLGTVAVTQAMLPLLRKASSPRIVNVSSGLGSITLNADPGWEYAPYKALGYGCSKAALNMFTVHLAYELRDTPIKVNSADPGYTATDLNHHSGPQTIEQGAAETVRLALLPDDGPTGTFSNSEGPLPW